MLTEREVEFIKKLKQEFVEEDEREFFSDRDYVGKTIDIYDMLIDNDSLSLDGWDAAIFDVVTNIIHYPKNTQMTIK